ncbi:MAG: glyoxalase [Bacteroidia bacterium]|nr:glyoxalase [Bacteroidia bacterium]MBT8311077.1 glyoxalase [Bacteroidia bacterium]NNK28600.1 glyoxalase [Flavobacteriaceae bacterium]NNL61128.1 glyoxalase [Flavobacteriaceae bacterium]RZW42930.1 MAG: glyoxalase [Flavobacteriaceae bacterium]
MDNRDLDLKSLRPIIPTAKVSDDMSFDERFQNLVLRPIIKLQNDFLILVFKNYIAKHKNVFYDLSLEKRTDYIENAIHKDMKFRNSIKGMVIGLFTIEEYQLYITSSSSLNKRMMSIVKERLLSNIQVFERSTLEAV